MYLGAWYVAPVWLILSVSAVILLLGLVSSVSDHRRLSRRKAYTVEYANRFSQFAAADEFSAGAYQWLTMRAIRMQGELGAYGTVDYKPPASQYYIRDYQMVINALPELQRCWADRLWLRSSTFNEMAMLVMDALTRYRGVLDDRMEVSSRQLRNPTIWLRKGVRLILLFPLYVLQWMDLVGEDRVLEWRESGLARVVSGIVTLVGLLSALVQIVVGWDRFTRFVTATWHTVFP